MKEKMKKKMKNKKNIEYSLKCAECGKKAVKIIIGKEITIHGHIREHYLSLKALEEIIPLIKSKNFRSLNHYFSDHHKEGLDGYCSQCNEIYCSDHLTIIPHYEDGWYDDTQAKCPKGHSWLMDD